MSSPLHRARVAAARAHRPRRSRSRSGSVDISRLITPSQRLALHASQLFTDAASAFRLGFNQPVPTVSPSRLATSEPFKQRTIGIDWRFQAARTTLNLGFSDYHQRYLLGSTNDNDWWLATALLDRQLSPVLNADIGVSFQRQEQVGTAANVSVQEAKTFGALADLRWQVGERLALRFLYAYSRQSGVYYDNQIGVTVSWALLGARALTTEPGALAPIAPASTRFP